MAKSPCWPCSTSFGTVIDVIVARVLSSTESVDHGLLVMDFVELLGPMLLSQLVEFLQQLGVRFNGLVKILPGDELKVRFIEIGIVGQQIEEELHVERLDIVVCLWGCIVVADLPDPAVLAVWPILKGNMDVQSGD